MESKKKEIMLILDSEEKYRQKKDQYIGLDIDVFVKKLVKLGYEVDIKDYFYLYENIHKIKNKTLVYTSHQNVHYKKYIEDIMYMLNSNNTLIPAYDSLLGHENKAFQEIERKKYKLDSLESWVIADLNELEKVDIKYPVVVKRPNSCSSTGVFLAKSKVDLYKIINKYFCVKDLEYYILKLKLIVKRMLKKGTYDWTYNRIKDYKYTRFILEEFIPDLDGDYKVLVYGDKYYILKRFNRKGSFKASGSGLHDFNAAPPKELLNFAKECFEKLSVPFAGFDIAIDLKKKCFLIEYQSIHIGPVTLMNSSRYFINKAGKWEEVFKKSILEEEYANAIDIYLKRDKKL